MSTPSSPPFHPNLRELSMTIRTATACFLGLAFLAGAGQSAAQKALPRIANPEALALEMAKALVAGDRERFTALAATREEMEELLTTAQPPGNARERQELK